MNTVTLELREYLKMRDELNGLKDFVRNPDEFILYLDYGSMRQYHIKKTENSMVLAQDLEKQTKVIAELRKELTGKSAQIQKTKTNFFKKLFKI